MCTRFVAYYRVSTEKQGKSGLGLEAQEAAAAAFIAGRGSDAKLLASYVEIESGQTGRSARTGKGDGTRQAHWRDPANRETRPA